MLRCRCLSPLHKNSPIKNGLIKRATDFQGFMQLNTHSPFFTPFYRNNTLLIQLIIDEFIHIYDLNTKFKSIIEEHAESDDVLNFHSSFTQFLHLLIGSHPFNTQTLITDWISGPVTKLKNYSEYFSQNTEHQNKLHFNLSLVAHQTWLVIVQNLELFRFLKKESTSLPLPQFSEQFQRAFYHLQMRCNQIRRLIPRIVSTLWEDENVILYLLQKKEVLAEIYGSKFLSKQFKSPWNEPQLQELLIKRYRARGFDSLVPIINQHFLKTPSLSQEPHL